jgi:uncharacterized protein with PQ loop repeat
VEEYINYVKTLTVHGYTPEQIQALLLEEGVDQKILRHILDYLETTVPKYALKKQNKDPQENDESHIPASLKQDYDYVLQQRQNGKSQEEIERDLTARGVDTTTKSILFQLAGRHAAESVRQPEVSSPLQSASTAAANSIPAKTTSRNRKAINLLILLVAAAEPFGVIPQVVAIYSHHNATGIVISTWLIFVLFNVTWLVYGLIEKQKVIIISGGLFTLLEGLVLVGAILYGGRW